MAAASGSLHEAAEVLGPAGVDRHRAIMSLMEELEAVDWYDQRVAAAADDELRAILAHNRDEEKEHAAMVLEWLQRHDERFAAELRARLFRAGPIVREENGAEAAVDGAAAPAPADGSLGIGSLRTAQATR